MRPPGFGYKVDRRPAVVDGKLYVRLTGLNSQFKAHRQKAEEDERTIYDDNGNYWGAVN